MNLFYIHKKMYESAQSDTETRENLGILRRENTRFHKHNSHVKKIVHEKRYATDLSAVP